MAWRRVEPQLHMLSGWRGPAGRIPRGTGGARGLLGCQQALETHYGRQLRSHSLQWGAPGPRALPLLAVPAPSPWGWGLMRAGQAVPRGPGPAGPRSLAMPGRLRAPGQAHWAAAGQPQNQGNEPAEAHCTPRGAQGPDPGHRQPPSPKPRPSAPTSAVPALCPASHLLCLGSSRNRPACGGSRPRSEGNPPCPFLRLAWPTDARRHPRRLPV